MNQLVLVIGGQVLEAVDDVARFAPVSFDGAAEGERRAVVHQPRAQPHTPERPARRDGLVGGG